MQTFILKDTTVINVEAIQSIGPIQNDGFHNYVFRIQFCNHWIDCTHRTKDEAQQERADLITVVDDDLTW
jgi:hypothetical protein